MKRRRGEPMGSILAVICSDLVENDVGALDMHMDPPETSHEFQHVYRLKISISFFVFLSFGRGVDL